MVQIAAASKLKCFASSIVLSLVLGNHAYGDATANTNPALSINIKTANTACTVENEVAFTSASKPIKCKNGKWVYSGISGVVRVASVENIKASDIGKIKYMTSTCPTGKRVLGGGCGLLSGQKNSQIVIMNNPTSDLRQWQCAYGPLTSVATAPYTGFLGNSPANMAAEAYCADY